MATSLITILAAGRILYDVGSGFVAIQCTSLADIEKITVTIGAHVTIID